MSARDSGGPSPMKKSYSNVGEFNIGNTKPKVYKEIFLYNPLDIYAQDPYQADRPDEAPLDLLKIGAEMEPHPPGSNYELKIQRYLRRESALPSDMLAAFRAFDGNESGKIAVGEFMEWMLRMGETLNPEEVAVKFDSADFDADGIICYEEFYFLMTGHYSKNVPIAIDTAGWKLEPALVKVKGDALQEVKWNHHTINVPYHGSRPASTYSMRRHGWLRKLKHRTFKPADLRKGFPKESGGNWKARYIHLNLSAMVVLKSNPNMAAASSFFAQTPKTLLLKGESVKDARLFIGKGGMFGLVLGKTMYPFLANDSMKAAEWVHSIACILYLTQNNLTPDKLDEYRLAFDEFDTLQRGHISLTAARMLLEAHGYPMSDELMADALHKCDMDNSKTLDFAEFLGVMLAYKATKSKEAELLEAFQYFDKDKSGHLDKEEFRAAVLGDGWGNLSTPEAYHLLNAAECKKTGQKEVLDMKDFANKIINKQLKPAKQKAI